MDSPSLFSSQPLTVTELTARIKQTLEQGFAHIEVKGEISRLTRPASGHLYFTIKDSHANISAVVWRSAAVRLKTRPTEGLEFIFNGHLSLYEPRGTYQMIVTHIHPAGAGQLAAEFERRKALFAQYGWFSTEHKKKIPPLPQHIGIVTSATAAAFEDVKKTLSTRPAWLKISLAPSIVQGSQAPASIAAAIQCLQDLNDKPDVILIVRGGGSMEDLWCFNDEAVVQAIAISSTPIITGIGHEIDTTLADYAADMRAATPSNAAELCCPSQQILRQSIPQTQRLRHRISALLHTSQQRLRMQQQGLQHQQERNLDQALQKSFLLQQRLLSSLTNMQQKRQQVLSHQCKQLLTLEPSRQLRQKQQHLHIMQEHLITCLTHILPERQHQLDGCRQLLMQHWTSALQKLHYRLQLQYERLHALDPSHVLQRGYSLSYDQYGKLVSHASAAQVGEPMRIRFQDGALTTRIESIQPLSSKAEDLPCPTG
ncbi:MAG: exodeoxyribonuclease VII large subunit [Mariprofundaceae bacterium]|nr:exodeoxyribonuclease VII large subunit [Mariprofundaceae bacterium]